MKFSVAPESPAQPADYRQSFKCKLRVQILCEKGREKAEHLGQQARQSEE